MVFGLGLFEEFEGGVLDDGDFLGSEAVSRPAEVVVEDHVEDPVEADFDNRNGRGQRREFPARFLPCRA